MRRCRPGELWRRIEAGEEQTVAMFRAATVLGVFADANDEELTVPDGWQTSVLGGEVCAAPSAPPPSDNDVPF